MRLENSLGNMRDSNSQNILTFYKGVISLSLILMVSYTGCTTDGIEELTNGLHPRLVKNKEVRKAIKHYQLKGDTLKLQALLFLLEHMDGHHAMTNILSEKYDSILSPVEFGGQIPAVVGKNGIVLERLITMEKKYGKVKSSLNKLRYDINSLNSAYLIENIDMAFKAWEGSPWSDGVSFTDFSENILPYRADQEPMHRWREIAYGNFSWVLERDSLDRIEACSLINDSIGNVLSNMIEMKMYPERLTYQNMYKFKVGICEDETAFALLAMRSVGLPVGIDFVPQWPWRSMGHSWNYLLLEDGSTIPFMGTESNPGEPHFQHEKKGKVYRKTFSKQSNSLAEIEKEHARIPKFFRSPYFRDVTHLYVKTCDVSIPLESSSESTGRYVYLTVFDNQKWEPIDWSMIADGQATFRNVEGGIAYLPTYYRDGRFIYTEQVFLMDDDGEVSVLSPDAEQTQTITLKRKYPLHKHLDDYLKNMVGGRFEASNHADFSNPFTIGTIEQKPEPYLRTIRNPAPKERFKYIRYVSSKRDSGRCNLAIFNIYGNVGKVLKGKVIGSKGSYKGYGAEKEKAFDNDPATFFDAQEKDWGKAWIGMELNEPALITRVDFMPRNDTNTIFEGQEYELFYWDKGWHGMGKKVADGSEQISFENVPMGALYLLHNHSGGKEERIFTWEDGKVTWY